MSHHRGFRAVIRRLRRGGRQHLSLALARWRGTPAPIRAPLPPPQRILVCRLNTRLGNTLFLTPLLRSLAATWPDAEIDVLLRLPAHADLLAGLPGVRRVHVLPKGVWRIARLVRELRRTRYDLAIDPNIQSSSNRVALTLSGARHRLGFAGHDQWLRLTHAAPRPTSECHQARQALYLLTDAIEGLQPELLRDLAVYPGTAARRQAHILLREALPPARGQAAWPVVGFFAEATGPKRLPAAWWRAWHAALTAAGTPVTVVQLLPPGGNHEPLIPGIATLRSADLSVLAAALGRMDLFVAADGGPMHLAAAAGVPVIGLFAATTPAQYAPLGRECLTLAAPLDPADVAAETRHHLARISGDRAESA